MAKALHGEGVSVDMATTDDEGRGLRKQGGPLGEAVQCDGFRVFYFAKQTEFYKASLPLYSWLTRHVSDYDIVHIHALFSFASIAAARAARARGVPYILRPLGLLNAYGMQQRRRLVKQWSFRLIEKPLLDSAAAIHYTSTQERDEAEHLKIKAPEHVIPLGIDLVPFQHLPDAEIFHHCFPETRGKQIILFLSRLDPKKGLDLLLEAFAKLDVENSNVHLVIAGSGPEEYLRELKNEAGSLGIAGRISWTGQLEGDVKLSVFAAATVFVLPSHSENFGIALLEAMAAGVACIASDQVALAQEAASENAICMVKRDVTAIAEALRQLLHGGKARAELALRGRTLAHERYSLKAMGALLNTLYGTLAKH
jgi:glycosyltransferase involved in cell wall biosynthesis